MFCVLLTTSTAVCVRVVVLCLLLSSYIAENAIKDILPCK